MSKLLLNSTCIACLMALGACSTTAVDEDPLISASEEVLRVFADTNEDGTPDQDLADFLAGGGEVVARQVSEASWTETSSANPVFEHVDAEVSVQGDGDDLLVTFNAVGNAAPRVVRIVDASALDSDVAILSTDDFSFNMGLSQGVTFADLLAGGGGIAAVRFGIILEEEGDGFKLQTRGLVGVETQDSMIADLGTAGTIASYTGGGGIDVRQVSTEWETWNANLQGDVSLTADFGAGTVSGSLTALDYQIREDRLPGGDWTNEETGALAGSILLDDADIQDNAFAGSLSADAALLGNAALPDFASAAGGFGYSGAFYGTDADVVGGTFSGTGTVGDTDYIGIGVFSADAVD
ncbi:MAG: transferrin-binding protein-like solute binding protein [Paracoccaceae bacterium]|nr:transferrin-binding protein-like solute binding protein [Paracoccaceae bacterium]